MRFPFLESPLPVRAALLFLCVWCCVDRATAADLADLFAAADSLSPAIMDARLELARARADYQAAVGMPNPTLFGDRETVSDGQVDETEQTYGIRQSLGYLWSYAPRRTATRHAYESARATFEETRRRLLVTLAEQALSAGALRQHIALVDTVLVYATRAGQSMEERFRLGDVSEYDLHRLQAEVLRLQQQRFNLRAEQQRVCNEFTQLSGLSAVRLNDFSTTPPVSSVFLSADQAVETALQQRPLLTANHSAQAAAEKAYAVSKWNQLPDIAVGVGRKEVEPGFSGVALQAELELPLFTQRRSERAYARTARDHAQIQLQVVRLQVEQEARAAYQRRQELIAEAPGAFVFDAEQARRDLYRGTQMYTQGELSPVEHVDILRSTIESFDTYLQLAHARLLAELELRRVTGLPLWEKP